MPTSPEHAALMKCMSTARAASGRRIPAPAVMRQTIKYFDPAIRHNGKFEKTKGYCTDLFFSQATKWMDEQVKAGEPFFTYLPLNAAHGPLQVADEYLNRHKGQVPDDVAKFYGMIENLDENFGRLLAQLKTWGIGEYPGDLHDGQRFRNRLADF
ncbi:MAG: sulfatase-like hydrolase/transferase [Giesbergeria sp.]